MVVADARGDLVPEHVAVEEFEACPHCNRKFNPKVAARHIPKCTTIKAKPRPPPSKGATKI